MAGNILILNHTGWLGGAELSLLRYLERTGIPRERILCVVDTDGPLHSEIELLGYETIAWRIPVPGLERNMPDRILSWLRLFWTCLSLARMVRKRKIRLFYANGHRGALLLMGLKILFPRVPLVTHVRDRIDGRLKRKMVIAASRRIISISRYVSRELGLEGMANGKVTMIPSGVDTDIFSGDGGRDTVRKELGIPKDAFVFGMFCQVLPWKGVREYIEASIEVVGTCDGVYCIMVGDDRFSGQTEYFDRLKRRVDGSGVAAKIIFTGFRKDIERYISCADAVVSASTDEPLGQTLLQAMAMGKPVIATSSGGPLEIVAGGETGLLVEPGDVRSLCAAMRRLSRDRDESRSMGRRGFERFAGHFLTAQQMADRIDAVLLDTECTRD